MTGGGRESMPMHDEREDRRPLSPSGELGADDSGPARPKLRGAASRGTTPCPPVSRHQSEGLDGDCPAARIWTA